MNIRTPYWPETARLSMLSQYEILDTSVETAFDAITRLAAQMCDTPMAAISVVDRDCLWFKSEIGLEIEQTPRDNSFCDRAIASEGLFVVPDAAVDPGFREHPLVANEPYVKFYAGAPLIIGDGVPIGTLCVFDCKPRHLSVVQGEGLVDLSRQIMALLKLNVARRQLDSATEQAAGLEGQLASFAPRQELRDPRAMDLVAPRGPTKILLVEDNEFVREETLEQLVSLGYRVIAASNGAEALEMLVGAGDVDLLFTDIMMPGGMTGGELAEQARLICPSLKVLYASGYFEGALLRNGSIEADVPLIVKPYRKKDLAQKVRETLRSISATTSTRGI